MLRSVTNYVIFINKYHSPIVKQNLYFPSFGVLLLYRGKSVQSIVLKVSLLYRGGKSVQPIVLKMLLLYRGKSIQSIVLKMLLKRIRAGAKVITTTSHLGADKERCRTSF